MSLVLDEDRYHTDHDRMTWQGDGQLKHNRFKPLLRKLGRVESGEELPL